MHPEVFSGKVSCCLPLVFKLFKKISVPVFVCVCTHIFVCGGREKASTPKYKYNKILATVNLSGGAYGCPLYSALSTSVCLKHFKETSQREREYVPNLLVWRTLPDLRQTFLSSFVFHPFSSCTLYPNCGYSGDSNSQHLLSTWYTLALF